MYAKHPVASVHYAQNHVFDKCNTRRANQLGYTKPAGSTRFVELGASALPRLSTIDFPTLVTAAIPSGSRLATLVALAASGSDSGLPPAVYAEAPLMKNHLSIELSIFSAGRFSLGGMGGSWLASMRLGECDTARLALRYRCQYNTVQEKNGPKNWTKAKKEKEEKRLLEMEE